MMAKVARAVDLLHSKGILHRDLKPSNIFLKEKDEPLVGDLGLAKVLDAKEEIGIERPDTDVQLTQPGLAVGTPHYMSPEQAAGKTAELTPATDVWALGVILYELLTGQRPFSGEDTKAVLDAIRHTEPKRPRALRPRINRDREAICLKCLEKDPEKRYSTAAALADDLERWLRGDPILPESLPRRILRKVRRHPLAASALILLIIAVGLVGLVAERRDSNRPVRAMQRELRAGRPVHIIENNKLRWFRWPLGETGFLPDQEGSDFISFQTFNLTLLEVLPDPQLESYRFHAKICHAEGGQDSEVGLFFFLTRYQTPRGPLLGLCSLTFNDLEDANAAPAKAGLPKEAMRGNSIVTRLRFARDVENLATPGRLDGKHDLGKVGFFKPTLGVNTPEKWRDLAVTVTPKQVELWLGNTKVNVLSREEVSQTLRDVLGGGGLLSDDFQLGNGLGLYCNQGVIFFQDVIVEPN
jgi:hypothetical protein